MASFVKVNDLGNFASFDVVWNKHPEGGREGDYLKVGGVTYAWNKYTRSWTQTDTTPGYDGTGAESVDGDLNVGGNLNVGGDVDIDGTLYVNDIRLKNEQRERFRGQSSFVAFVFRRADSRPTAPTGGRYDDPRPDAFNVWLDHVPQGNQPIWMSKRIFTSDGQSPQEDAWSTPALMSDAENYDVEFSTHDTNTVPAAPAAGNLGWLWFDPVRNPGANWSAMNWMATRTKSLAADGTAVWSDWTIMLIRGNRGNDGDGVEFVFYLTKNKIAPTAVIDRTHFQDDDYCPGVGNKVECGGNGDSFTDNPTGVNETYKYEWVMQRKKKYNSTNGEMEWKEFTTPAVLWAAYGESHDISISDDGYWVIDGVKTDKRAVGRDGNGVAVKGSVLYYDTNDDDYQEGDSTLEDVTSPSIGDCWIVLNGTLDDADISGHLFICVATTGTLAQMWNDLGEFRGEDGDDGHSQYMYLAWASDVRFNNGVFSTVEGFTTDPAEGQDLGWLGIWVDDEEHASITSANASSFKWNYLMGKDGVNYEYVYIRTKTDEIEPEISEVPGETANYNDDEHLPEVSNYEDFGDNIEDDTFTDDPSGVCEEWPFEWQSKREKIDGQWGAFLSPAILHRNWAADGTDGQPGESQVWIKTEKAVIVVDADKDGKIAGSGTLDLSFDCWLMVGKNAVSPVIGSCRAEYGSTSLTLSDAINPSNPRVNIPLSLEKGNNTSHETKDLVITLANASVSASVTVPVVINRKGADGTPGATGPSGPCLRFRGNYVATELYTYDGTFRDCVKHGGSYWMLNTAKNGETVAEPSSASGNPWSDMGDAKFFATELLLAENAFIELLAGNSIRLLDVNGNKTAGINEDGHGSYCIYYPNGRKMMEFSFDGYIRYFNNNASNTERWRLGYGGEIETGEGWQSIWLASLGSNWDSGFSSSATWNLTERYKFVSIYGQTNYSKNGEIHQMKDLNSIKLDEGYYTLNSEPERQNLLSKISVVHINSSGKIDAEGILYSDGTHSSILDDPGTPGDYGEYGSGDLVGPSSEIIQ